MRTSQPQGHTRHQSADPPTVPPAPTTGGRRCLSRVTSRQAGLASAIEFRIFALVTNSSNRGTGGGRGPNIHSVVPVSSGSRENVSFVKPGPCVTVFMRSLRSLYGDDPFGRVGRGPVRPPDRLDPGTWRPTSRMDNERKRPVSARHSSASVKATISSVHFSRAKSDIEHAGGAEGSTSAPSDVITPFRGPSHHGAYALRSGSPQVRGLRAVPEDRSEPFATLAPEITLVPRDQQRYATTRLQKRRFRGKKNNTNPIQHGHNGHVVRKGNAVSPQPESTPARHPCRLRPTDTIRLRQPGCDTARPPPA